MSWRNLNLCGAALLIGLALGASSLIRHANGQAAAPPAPPSPAADTSSDVQLGSPSKDDPNLITPLMEGGVLRDNHHGPALRDQEFEFNPATHEVGLAKNSPDQQVYGYAEIDAAYFNADLPVFDYFTTSRSPIGKIVLLCTKKKLFVTYNYVVAIMGDDPPKVDPATYCANVQFVKGAESGKPGTTVTMHRNDEKPAPVADGLISKINRKTDVITWSVERDGAVVKSGSFGFPVVANEANLVKYVINLP
jgi:hypothetical protein